MTALENIRVLFVTHYTALLGANRSMLQLIIELREKGIEPTVLMPKCKRNVSELAYQLLNHNIPYIEAPVRSIKHQVFWKVFPNYLMDRVTHRIILKSIRGREFDIVHSNSSIISAGKYLAKKLKIKHVWHLREFGDLDYNLKTPMSKSYQKILYSGENHFIAISRKIKNHFLPYLSDQPIELIYNGIKIPTPNLKRDNNSKSKINICIVGLLYENKGQLLVLQAIYELVNNLGVTDFHLNIIGSGQPKFVKILEDFVAVHSLNNYVDFLGYKDNITDILASQDIGIMASTNEAFGRTTVEYMMAELCVICSNSGANREIIEDEVNGLFFEKNNPKSLANRLELLISDKELMRRLAIKGKKCALEKFSSTRNSEQVYNLYRNLLIRN